MASPAYNIAAINNVINGAKAAWPELTVEVVTYEGRADVVGIILSAGDGSYHGFEAPLPTPDMPAVGAATVSFEIVRFALAQADACE